MRNETVSEFFEEIDATFGLAFPILYADGEDNFVYLTEDGHLCDDVTDSEEIYKENDAWTRALKMQNIMKTYVTVYSNANSETYVIDPNIINPDDSIEKLMSLYPNIKNDWPERENVFPNRN